MRIIAILFFISVSYQLQAKPTFWFLASSTCKPCVELDEMLSEGMPLRQEVDKQFHFRKVFVDHPLYDSIKEAFEVKFLPQIVYTDEGGRVLNRYIAAPDAEVIRYQMNRISGGYYRQEVEQAYKNNPSLENWTQYLLNKADRCDFDYDEALQWINQIQLEDFADTNNMILAYRFMQNSSHSFLYPFDHEITQFFWNNYDQVKHLFPEQALFIKLMCSYKKYMIEALMAEDYSQIHLLDIAFPDDVYKTRVLAMHDADQWPRSGMMGYVVREELYWIYYDAIGEKAKADSVLSAISSKLDEEKEWINPLFIRSLWSFYRDQPLGEMLMNKMRQRLAEENWASRVAIQYFIMYLKLEDLKTARKIYKELKKSPEVSLEKDKRLQRMEYKLKKARKNSKPPGFFKAWNL